MKTNTSPENLVRLFGMANIQALTELKRIEREFAFHAGAEQRSLRDDQSYYPQFTEAVRADAKRMAEHYELFYCLERTVRQMVQSRLAAVHGDAWWSKAVEKPIRERAENIQKQDFDSGFTPRSEELLDFISFNDLSKIITGNWDVFGEMFVSERAVAKVMDNLNTLRRPIAHCTMLADDEIARLRMSLRDWFRLME